MGTSIISILIWWQFKIYSKWIKATVMSLINVIFIVLKYSKCPIFVFLTIFQSDRIFFYKQSPRSFFYCLSHFVVRLFCFAFNWTKKQYDIWKLKHNAFKIFCHDKQIYKFEDSVTRVNNLLKPYVHLFVLNVLFMVLKK